LKEKIGAGVTELSATPSFDSHSSPATRSSSGYTFVDAERALADTDPELPAEERSASRCGGQHDTAHPFSRPR